VVAIYRGRSMDDLELVGASADPMLIRTVGAQLLKECTSPKSDPVLESLQVGQRQALRLIVNEAQPA
jgi:hypothetical protein